MNWCAETVEEIVEETVSRRRSVHEELVPLGDADERLRRLADDVQRQEGYSEYESEPWVTREAGGEHPVLIVGSGHAGLVSAYGLRRKGVSGVVVIDAAPVGFAGPWATYARMQTLRTPKNIKWPTWGVPAASPRAWFEARYGESAWQRIDYVPRRDWHAFLEWYRITLELPVQFDSSVTAIRGGADGAPFEVEVTDTESTRTIAARRVVLATGLEGAGGRHLPVSLFAELPSHVVAHTHDHIDFAALAGRRIGILGGGTGAFDNAATALEHGAASAAVHMRRPTMPTVSPYRWMEFPGIIEHFASFTDEQKWAFNVHLTQIDQPASQNAITRAGAQPNFSFHTSSPWVSVAWSNDEIVVKTPRGEERYDYVIAATGITADLAQRPELGAFVDDIAVWSDRLPDGSLAQSPRLGHYPYLDENFGLRSRSGSDDARLSRILMFNHGSRLSLGPLSHQISGLYGGVHRLVSGITNSIFRERSAELLGEYLDYDTDVGIVFAPHLDPGVAPVNPANPAIPAIPARTL